MRAVKQKIKGKNEQYVFYFKHVMRQLVLSNISLDLSNFMIYIEYTALYMISSVLFGKLYSSQGKGLRTDSLNEEQTFYFYLC